MNEPIHIYTDGSCHTQLKIGGWASIILIRNKKIILKSIVTHTTHNHMELTAVIKAVEYVQAQSLDDPSMNVYSDSQYVVHLADRKEKLKQNHFTTKMGTPVQNADLVQTLIQQMDTQNIRFIKVKAHQKNAETINYNREVDILVRKILRSYITQNLLL